MDWKAKWIWDSGEAQPKNYWLCFRKTFESQAPFEKAYIKITADSRYVLYINGFLIGNGPARSWPSEQLYDVYEIGSNLTRGKNTIAVLVTHFGISNFQYIEGRGGLFAQLEILEDGLKKIIGTDVSWKNHIHPSYIRNSERISCQQGWAEVYDATVFDNKWIDSSFDDKNWEQSIVIGEYGVEPWKRLKRRDIPLMREEPVYPARVDSLREVLPRGVNISLDLQPNFFPGEVDSGTKMFTGYIASIIKSSKTIKGRVSFPWPKSISLFGDFSINGLLYNVDGDKREIEIEINEGRNLFLMDVSGKAVGFFMYLNIETELPVEFIAPGFNELDFVTIGPFVSKPFLNIGEDIDNGFDWEDTSYKSVFEIKCEEELNKYEKWIKPVKGKQVCINNVYMSSVYKDIYKVTNISYEEQNMIIPNDEYSLIRSGEKGDVEVILDFGKEVAGYLEFYIEASSGTIIDFYGVEYIGLDGKEEHTEGLNCTLRYITRKGRQHYRSVIRRGFRYLIMTFRKHARPVRLYRIFINLNTYPVANVGRFECSDWKLNRIWEISKYTARLCMEDTFVDCPAYEQVFWVGDSRSEALINYYVFGSYEIVKHSLKLAANSLERSSLPECNVPSGHQAVITAWALFWVNACKEYYWYSIDTEFLKEIYPSLVKAVKGFIHKINQKGLLELQAFNMLDWAPMDTPDKGVVTHQNAELVKVLVDMAEIAKILGNEHDAVEFKRMAESIRDAINRYLWDDKRLAFVDCIHENGEKSKVISIQTNIMVYICDCLDNDRKEILEKYLLNIPGDFVNIGSPFLSFFYFEALAKINAEDEILRHIREEWGEMLNNGATTCWETFPGHEKGRLTRSHCHAWSAAPGYFLGAYILGVKPLEPGFKKVLIDPAACDLEWANGSIPVVDGRIDISWRKAEKGLKVNIRGPINIEYLFGDGIEVEKLLH